MLETHLSVANVAGHHPMDKAHEGGLMRFEIGKVYQHTSGQMMKIVGEVETTTHGKTLVGEVGDPDRWHDLKPIGHDEAAAENWAEATEAEWMANFS